MPGSAPFSIGVTLLQSSGVTVASRIYAVRALGPAMTPAIFCCGISSPCFPIRPFYRGELMSTGRFTLPSEENFDEKNKELDE